MFPDVLLLATGTKLHMCTVSSFLNLLDKQKEGEEEEKERVMRIN